MIPDKTVIVAKKHELLRELEMGKSIVRCPFKADCQCKYKNIIYCESAKHLKCVEYQANLLKKCKG